MAPELVTQKADKASDIFAFGLVMFDVHFPPTDVDSVERRQYQRPLLNELLSSSDEIVVPAYANETVNEPLANLLRSMLARDAHLRPTANDALSKQYFQLQLHARRDGVGGKRQCVVMFDEYWQDEGIECANSHFVSRDAIEGLVQSLVVEGAAKHNGRVNCPGLHDGLPCREILPPQVCVDLFCFFSHRQYLTPRCHRALLVDFVSHFVKSV
jgi:hypothetical protein